MAQNIYDDAAFFEGYSQFPRSREGLAAAGEWPSLRSMLPSLTGKRVLDLGCGFGYHAEWALEQGAASVTALDISDKMLESARRRCLGKPIRFARADLETADFGTDCYDLAFSSLAVHYIENFDGFCARVRRALTDTGHFVFSMEHPVFAARAKPEFMADAEGHVVGAVDDYLREGRRLTKWIADGVIKYHRLISTVITSLQRHGMMLDRIDEWAAKDTDIATHPEWAAERYQPMFLLLATHVDTTVPTLS